MLAALLESPDQRLQCPATMTYRVLLLRRGLAEGLTELHAEKERVVAKPPASPWRVEDRTLAHALKDLGNGAGPTDQDEHAPVARPTTLRLCPREPPQQLGVVGGINFGGTASGPGPSLGPGTGSTAQHQDLEPRVVRDRRKPRPSGEVLRLAARVGFEAVAQLEPVFLLGLKHPGPVRKDHLVPRGLQNPPYLPLLARAPGGGEQPHDPRAACWALKSWRIPDSAMPTSRSSSAREKVPCSPVPCTSTNRSGWTITTFESTMASRSSR